MDKEIKRKLIIIAIAFIFVIIIAIVTNIGKNKDNKSNKENYEEKYFKQRSFNDNTNITFKEDLDDKVKPATEYDQVVNEVQIPVSINEDTDGIAIDKITPSFSADGITNIIEN